MRFPAIPPAARLTAATFALLSLASCGGGGGGGGGQPPDNPPIIDDVTRNPEVVVPGGTVILTVAASDPDGDALGYSWSAESGSFSGGIASAEVNWIAPLVEGEVAIGVIVSARGASAQRSVFVEVNELAPDLEVTPPSLNLAAAESSGTLYVSNIGETALNWDAATDSAWMGVAPASGITDPATTDTLIVTVNRAGLPSGRGSGAVTVDSDGGIAVVPVFVTVLPAAALVVEPSSLDFGTSTDTLALVVSNAGIGTMAWSQTDSITSPWVGASPGSGMLGAGSSDTLAVVVQRGSLSTGEHIGRLDIASDGGFATVGVRLENP